MTKRTLQPEDIYRLRTVGEADVSPNGRYLAYVVKGSDQKSDKDQRNIYLLDLQTEQAKRMTSSGKDHSPCFSPDGSRLAFISARSGQDQIWVLELDGGEAWHLPTEEAVSGLPHWFPDGRQVAYQARVFPHDADWNPYPGAPAGDGQRLADLVKCAQDETKSEDKTPKNEVKVITRLRYRGDGVGYFGHQRRHLFVTAVPSQAPLENLQPAGRQITTGDWDFGAPAISPDGRYLVAAARQTAEADYEPSMDLWLYVLETGEQHLLYQGPGPISQPLWSPDGSVLSFVGHDNRQNVSTSSDLWLLPIAEWLVELEAGKRPPALGVTAAKNLTRPLDRPVGAHAGPELRHGGKVMFWAGQQLYFILSDRGAGCIYAVDSRGEQLKRILVDYDQSITSIAGNGDVLVFASSQPDKPEELFLLTAEGGRPLTGINDQFLGEVSLCPWQKITYPSQDGQEIDGWLIYPRDYQVGQRYPLLLLVHGGPHGAYGPAFMFAGQIFAGLGYLVLFANPRGSTTYGQDFTCAIDKNWGVVDYADIMAGVDTVVERGLADAEQLFVHGWSFGGYMTCWLVTQTNRFRAACGGASVTNLLSDYGTSDILWADEWEYGGQPWRDSDHLLRHSPLAHVEQVTTPILLMHGEGDLRVPISQTEEFYTALRRLGKVAVMIRYPGEFHGLRRPLHRVDRYRRLLAWFEHYRQA
jgi:dipeptidyl aminopeptidase/acylaminoacyl peptidase